VIDGVGVGMSEICRTGGMQLYLGNSGAMDSIVARAGPLSKRRSASGCVS